MVIQTIEHAAEGGHWYTQAGEQVATVTGASGQPVTPDIRHARKLDLAPGVTTILRAADRPALTAYRERQAILAALTLTRQPEENDDAYVSRVLADAKAAAKQAAERGTAIHAQVESYFRGQAKATPIAAAAEQELASLTGCGHGAPWVAERECVADLGYATKADLHLPAGLFSAHPWLVDIKTKDGNLADDRLYDEHAQQLAATRYALACTLGTEWLEARCAILFVSRTETAARAVEVPQPELYRGGECFYHILAYWQSKNRYRPSWAIKTIHA